MIPDIAGGDSGTTDALIRPYSVIPGLFRDLFKKAVMLKQPPLDVSKIPDIAGGDSGTTDGDIAGAISGRRIEVFYYDTGTTHFPSSRTCSGTLTRSGALACSGTYLKRP